MGALPISRGSVKYLFVVDDCFSKVIFANIFENYISEFREMSSIISDHETQFTSAVWINKMEHGGIKVIFLLRFLFVNG